MADFGLEGSIRPLAVLRHIRIVARQRSFAAGGTLRRTFPFLALKRD
jgi:hypothetical protein